MLSSKQSAKTRFFIATNTLLAVLAVGLLLPSFAFALPNNHLIDNAVFLNAKSMSADSIQSFLVSKNSKLATLKVTEKSTTEILDYYPNYNKTVPVSQAIYDAAQVYGINPEAIMATLQKEQSLITDTSPEDSQLRFAMGYGCPDSAGCSSAVAGLFYQIDNGTWAFRAHFERASGNTWWGKAPSTYPCKGTTRYYSPGLFPGTKESFYDESGTKIATFTIANAATAALYCYTPHPYNNPNGLYGLPVQGTTGDYYTGSYNFVRSFERWFGPTTAYSHMDQPRWMQLSVDLQKQYPGTGEVVDSVLTAGTQIYFSSKVTVNGITYLRTQHDTDKNEDKGIPISELEDIPVDFTAMTQPRWMALDSVTTKIDPLTNTKIGEDLPVDTKIYFPTKFTIGGTTYLRTQHDTDEGKNIGIALPKLTDTLVEFESTATPRWMQAKTDTFVLDLRGYTDTGSVITSGTQQYYRYKTVINGNTYVNPDLPTAGTYTGVPLSDLGEVPLHFSSMLKPRWMQLSVDSNKQDPITEKIFDPLLPLGKQIYFSSKFTVGGKTYLRTQHDTLNNLNTAIPITDIEELQLNYIPMLNPRTLVTKYSIYKKDPVTNKNVDSLIQAGAQISFSQKIDIGGVTYLRTTHDTSLGYDKVIALSTLREK
jgi:hypothetical protein